MRQAIVLSAAILAAFMSAAIAQQTARIDPAVVDAAIKATFKGAPAEWQARIEPDAAQRLCSQSPLKLTPAEEKPDEDPRTHWAFVKPVRPRVAAGNPIDALLDAERKSRGLVANAQQAFRGGRARGRGR